jgi:NADH-quinone oxidoreductase subunit A
MLLIYIKLLQEYAQLFWFAFFCLFLVVIIPTVTFFVSPKIRSSEKLSAYECGFEPFDDSKGSFDVHFYIVAILFILLDLEIAFIFPWATTLYFLGGFGFWVMILFLAILTLGFIYEWFKGVLT